MSRQYLILISFLTLCSCRHNTQTKYEGIAVDKDKKTHSTENIIDNEYTQIVLSLCDEVYNFKYKIANTEYFDLNTTLEPKECFVFASDLVCGGPMGSCGQNIEIYKRIGEKYEIVFVTCGFNLTSSKVSSFGYLTFTYNQRDGVKYKVFFNGKTFEEQPVAVNNLDYDKIKMISDMTNYDITSFYPDDNSFEENGPKGVKVEKFKIGYNLQAELYTVNLAPVTYFLFYNEELIFSTSDIRSIETIVDDSKDFYDLKIYSIYNYIMTIDTSYLVPSTYKYSRTSKNYEISNK